MALPPIDPSAETAGVAGGRNSARWRIFAGRRPAYIAIGFAIAAWSSLRLNWFYHDDFVHLFVIADERLADFLLQPFGGHMLVLRNAVFALSWFAFGTNPALYYAVVQCTHALNTALAFAIIRRLTGSALLACAGASLYAVSPLQAGTLGWYSVYGQALAVTFLAGVLLDVARVTARDDAPVSTPRVLLWTLGAYAASLCFGTGMAMAMALPAAVVAVLGLRRLPTLPRTILALLPLAVATTWGALQWRALHAHGDAQAEAGEAVLLALWTSWQPIVDLFGHLAAYGLAALPLADLATALPDTGPVVPLLALLPAGVLVAGAVLGQAAERRWLVALGLLTLAAWGGVAFGRGALAAAYHGSGEVLARQTRYHSAAIFPLTIALCVALFSLARRLPPPRSAQLERVAPGLLAGVLVLLVASHVCCAKPLDHYSDARLATEITRHQFEAAIAAAPAGAEVVIPNGIFPLPLMGRQYFPGTVGIFVLYYPDDTVDGRRVRFSAPTAQVEAARRRGGRLARLLVADPSRDPPNDPQNDPQNDGPASPSLAPASEAAPAPPATRTATP